MKPTASAMSQPPNHSLRWVEIDPVALREALTEFADGGDSIDTRANGYGFGADLVSEIAQSLGLGVDGIDDSWVRRAHRRAAHRFFATVINTKVVPEGSAISYGGHYRTAQETTLALCSAGFADGVPRLNPVGGEVVVGGVRVPIAGRIAMDQLIVDLGTLEVTVGDTVEIWGSQVTIAEWAQWSGRDEVSIAAALSPRVRRLGVSADD